MSQASEDLLDRLWELCDGKVDLYNAFRACSDRKGVIKLGRLVDYIVAAKAKLNARVA